MYNCIDLLCHMHNSFCNRLVDISNLTFLFTNPPLDLLFRICMCKVERERERERNIMLYLVVSNRIVQIHSYALLHVLNYIKM